MTLLRRLTPPCDQNHVIWFSLPESLKDSKKLQKALNPLEN